MSREKKGKNWPKRIKKFFFNMSNFQIILIVYLFVTMLFACLLLLPISQKSGENVSFLDALFTAASAFSDTGLTVKTTVTTWSDFGQAIIAILILLGGIGIFAIKVYVINIIFKRSISITSRNILEKERGSNNSGDVKKTIKISITFLVIAILISTAILWPLFYFEKGNFNWNDLSKPGYPLVNQVDNSFVDIFAPNENGTFDHQFSEYDPYKNISLSFKCAIFHSISAINNAGFDILSDCSLFPYYSVYSIQIIFIILLIIGGIGFPVIYDVIQYFNHKIRHRTDFRFSLFTKVSCTTYLIIFLTGLSLTLLFEIPNKSDSIDGIWVSDYTGSTSDKLMCIFFHVFSTRNAGFSTLDPHIAKFSNSTLIVFSIMMFIGSAPSSTAGGIRTTTIAIVIVAIWNRIRGIKGVRMFKRKINDNVINSAFIVVVISIFIVLLTSLICFTSLDTMWGKASSEDLTFADIFYDVCSAFGTTGLSTGLSSSLNVISKLAMILTMFIGQLGISSTMLVWRKNNSKNNYSYIEEDILIG